MLFCNLLVGLKPLKSILQLEENLKLDKILFHWDKSNNCHNYNYIDIIPIHQYVKYSKNE